MDLPSQKARVIVGTGTKGGLAAARKLLQPDAGTTIAIGRECDRLAVGRGRGRIIVTRVSEIFQDSEAEAFWSCPPHVDSGDYQSSYDHSGDRSRTPRPLDRRANPGTAGNQHGSVLA